MRPGPSTKGTPSPGVGLDLVSVERIRRVVRRTPGFLDYFHPDERAASEAAPRPYLHLAACFAAKEALLKAFGLGVFDGVALAEIVFDPPSRRLAAVGRAAERLGRGPHPTDWCARGGFVWVLVVVGPRSGRNQVLDGGAGAGQP